MGVKLFSKYCSYANWPSAIPEKNCIGWEPTADHEKEENECSNSRETREGISVFVPRLSCNISTAVKFIHGVQLGIIWEISTGNKIYPLDSKLRQNVYNTLRGIAK